MKTKKCKFEVKHYWSPDIYNPWAWKPDDNSVFYLLEMNIGLTNDDHSDIYSLIIATPEGIMDLRKERSLSPQLYKMLLLDTYEWKEVVRIIEERLSRIKVYDSIQISNELANIFHWEYEGMS